MVAFLLRAIVLRNARPPKLGHSLSTTQGGCGPVMCPAQCPQRYTLFTYRSDLIRKASANAVNYFSYATAAQRYSEGRPFFHPLVAQKIQELCGPSTRIDCALDVGCGTGQSSLPLAEIAHTVVGVDSSYEMLSRATCHSQVRYIQAPAEQLPFRDAAFGLITVGLAFHWLDRQRFLCEARRVLRPGGWLVIYNDVFIGRMAGNPGFEAWFRKDYLVRYPSPPRNREPFTDSEALAHGFAAAGADQFLHEVQFMPQQLVNYLLTQTNVIAAVEAGTKDLQSITDWLLTSVRPLFRTASDCFSFWCDMQFFKRS